MHTSFLRGIFVICCVMVCSSLPIFAKDTDSIDWEPGEGMVEAVANVIVGVNEGTKDSEYGYDDGWCILGAYIHQGNAVSITKELEGGVTYMFAGGGDSHADDVDIAIEDEDGNVLEEDDATDASPIVMFTPDETAEYTVTLKLYKSRADSYCVMATLREGGYELPIESMTDTLSSVIAACLVAKEESPDATFHHDDAQWALFGSILEEGTSATVSGLTLEAGQHFFVAAGDSEAKDIDLFLRNGNDKTLESDTEKDEYPMFGYDGKAGSDFVMEIKNVSSKGATLVMGAIVDLPK